jgi:hypothetical protein
VPSFQYETETDREEDKYDVEEEDEGDLNEEYDDVSEGIETTEAYELKTAERLSMQTLATPTLVLDTVACSVYHILIQAWTEVLHHREKNR